MYVFTAIKEEREKEEDKTLARSSCKHWQKDIRQKIVSHIQTIAK